jgi:hypothetical protein
MDMFRMAERFSDPLFERVGKLSVMGWLNCMEYFEMETSQDGTQDMQTNILVEYFGGNGGHML